MTEPENRDVLKRFVTTCQAIGREIPIWSQGAGGNISVKDSGTLWIKASGARLANVTLDSGYAGVPLTAVVDELRGLFEAATKQDPASLEDSYSETVKKYAFKTYGRPSMETGFHAVLEKKWVAHFHSLPAILMAHAAQSPNSRWREREDGFLRAIPVLPALMPGLRLSAQLARHASSEIILLQNHGVILQSDEPFFNDEGQVQGTLALWQKTEDRFCADYQLPPRQYGFENARPTPMRIYFPDAAVFWGRIQSLLIEEECGPSEEPMFSLKEAADTVDLDAAENWLATCWLYHAAPDLTRLPHDIAASISSLPTELWRRHITTESKNDV